MRTGNSAAPFENPDASSIAIDVHADYLSPSSPLGQLRPVFYRAVGIGRRIGIGLAVCVCARHPGHYRGNYSEHEENTIRF